MFTEEYQNVQVSGEIRKWIEKGFYVVNIWHVNDSTFVTYRRLQPEEQLTDKERYGFK